LRLVACFIGIVLQFLTCLDNSVNSSARHFFVRNYQTVDSRSVPYYFYCGDHEFWFKRNDDTRLTAIFQDNLSESAPECLHSGLYWS